MILSVFTMDLQNKSTKTNLSSVNTLKTVSNSSNRSSSVPPRLNNERPQLSVYTNTSTPSSPSSCPSVKSKYNSNNEDSFSTPRDNNQDLQNDLEPRMAKGWVRHVIGKLQQTESEV